MVVAAPLAGVAATAVTEPVGPPVPVVVQGGGPRGIPAVAGDPTDVLRRHLDVSRPIPTGTDLIVWPENVVDLPAPVATTRQGARLGALAQVAKATLIAGVTEAAGESWFRIAAVA